MSIENLLKRAPSSETLTLWLEKIPYAAYLGIQADMAGEEITFILPPDEKLVGNPTLPAVHGGVVAAYLEQASALHLISKMKNPVTPKTIDFSIDYLRPARLKPLFARCSLTRQGQNVANITVSCWHHSPDTPVATARAHFLITED